VQTWLSGDVATPNGLATSATFAMDLASLVGALRAADTGGRHFAGNGRGGNLEDSDEWMAVCFRESEDMLPVDQLRSLWATFRALPAAGPDMMTHGDLIPGNLLVDGEHLVGVIDGGNFGPADPRRRTFVTAISGKRITTEIVSSFRGSSRTTAIDVDG
jgi:aminoglycoside phosphotransferase (APT) family kinase protein